MASLLPSFPTDITRLSTFPYLEGQQWEFKESAAEPCLSKLIPTVCAFLNSAGGYMVFGIRDDGCLLGISRKAVDKVLLRVDDIIHAGTIKNTVTGGHLTPAELKAYTVPFKGWDGDNHLLVVQVTSAVAGHIYKMNNGMAMYRLAASNLAATTFIFGDEHVLRGLQSTNDKLRLENKRLTTDNLRLRQSIATLNNENTSIAEKVRNATRSNVELLSAVKTSASAHMAAEAALKSTNDKLTEVIALLHARILADKEEAEARMKHTASRSGWLCGLF